MLPFQSFNKVMHLIPSFWSIFLITLPSILRVVSSQTDPYFLKVTEQADSVWTDAFFEARKRRVCIHGWLSIPCRTRSFVLGAENSVALPLLKEPAFLVLLLPLAPGIWLCGSSYTLQICTAALSTGISPLLSFVEMTCWQLWCFLWRGWDEEYGYLLSSSECFFLYFILSLFSYSMNVLSATIAICWHTCFHQTLQLPWDEPYLIYHPTPYSQGQSKKQALNKCLLNLPIRLLRVLPSVWVYEGYDIFA